MDRGRLPYHIDLYLEGGSWMFRENEDLFNARGFKEHRWREAVPIGPAIGPQRLTRKEAQRAVWERLPLVQRSTSAPTPATMTVTTFVENVFVPEHVAIKGLSGRTHYRAILKHVITPEEVHGIFKVDVEKSRARLRAIPDWPYIGHLGLTEVQPEHVEQLILAARARGYSVQTAIHIRNVVSAIFSHAKKGDYLVGENPAVQVATPGMTRKEAHTISLPQMKALLENLRYPEREMVLMALLTGMNVAEICGLQWKHVNLGTADVELNGEVIGPRTISVRKQWYRGELASVKIGRTRNLAIPELLYPVLCGLGRRPRYTRPDDFVLVSEIGTPVNETNIASRRLRPVGKQLSMPWLSWHVFRRTRKEYLQKFGNGYESRLEMVVRSQA
jgi:integrase